MLKTTLPCFKCACSYGLYNLQTVSCKVWWQVLTWQWWWNVWIKLKSNMSVNTTMHWSRMGTSKRAWRAQVCTLTRLEEPQAACTCQWTPPCTEEWGCPNIRLGRACDQDWTCSGPQPVWGAGPSCTSTTRRSWTKSKEPYWKCMWHSWTDGHVPMCAGVELGYLPLTLYSYVFYSH